MKFEIDKKIIDEVTLCQHNMVCLDGDVSPYCKITECKEGENSIIFSESKPHYLRGTYCCYKLSLQPPQNLCGCPVRKEIFKKYKV